MNSIFILTIIFVFLTIFVESTNLILQLKGRILTKWFGKKAFTIHMISTGFFWMITFCLFVILQLDFGLWIALIGFAILTGSIYNSAIAVEFIIIMIPHIMLENKPLKK